MNIVAIISFFIIFIISNFAISEEPTLKDLTEGRNKESALLYRNTKQPEINRRNFPHLNNLMIKIFRGEENSKILSTWLDKPPVETGFKLKSEETKLLDQNLITTIKTFLSKQGDQITIEFFLPLPFYRDQARLFLLKPLQYYSPLKSAISSSREFSFEQIDFKVASLKNGGCFARGVIEPHAAILAAKNEKCLENSSLEEIIKLLNVKRLVKNMAPIVRGDSTASGD
ncbi:MAG TPA: hypothetical protein PKD37_01635 [Oligoflexia bacterium]|nr:hypothetical protein [Oligoflexia bacterium]HMP26678.1 hypothetical protein [Oligoflexia bacterium]